MDTSKCTPVTAETFKKWYDAKMEKKKAADAKKFAEQNANQKKGKGGNKGSAVSGKALFALDSSLFVDDKSAVNDEDILAMSEPEDDDEDKDSDADSSDSDSDDSDKEDDKEEPKKGGAKAAAKPPAAPPAAAAPAPAPKPAAAEVAVKGADGKATAVTLQKDLYMDDDGLDDLDDLDDLSDDDEEEEEE